MLMEQVSVAAATSGNRNATPAKKEPNNQNVRLISGNLHIYELRFIGREFLSILVPGAFGNRHNLRHSFVRGRDFTIPCQSMEPMPVVRGFHLDSPKAQCVDSRTSTI